MKNTSTNTTDYHLKMYKRSGNPRMKILVATGIGFVTGLIGLEKIVSFGKNKITIPPYDR